MELETINKLYLELSQVATVVTAREVKLVAKARNVVHARRYQGEDGWDVLKNAIAELEDELEKFK